MTTFSQGRRYRKQARRLSETTILHSNQCPWRRQAYVRIRNYSSTLCWKNLFRWIHRRKLKIRSRPVTAADINGSVITDNYFDFRRGIDKNCGRGKVTNSLAISQPSRSDWHGVCFHVMHYIRLDTGQQWRLKNRRHWKAKRSSWGPQGRPKVNNDEII